MDDLKKYAERQAYNTTADYDDEAKNQAIAMPLPVIPPIRPQLQNQNQHFLNPNMLQNPFNEAHQLLQQQQQQQIAYFH
uniref:Uncharacterized protein n=1 Tax=Panagrolaimus davidi TaxID=227884 RepID=A0A914QY53_9BILA